MTRALTLAARQEIASDLIAKREFRWCRARLMHALAGAHAQGVLDEVLTELLPDGTYSPETLADDIGSWLDFNGWEHGAPDDPGVPDIFDDVPEIPSADADPEDEGAHGPPAAP